jgi:diguanylate cyclase (GGDEF)-like protein
MCASVLVAEDDDVTRLIFKRILEAQGHGVALAEDGERAWERIISQPPDLLLCDWLMPGVDGVELCRRIKEDVALRAVYVIIVTVKGHVQERIEALEAGADEFLSKPIDRAELEARVRVGLRIVEYQRMLRDMALTDALTGLPNRRSFDAAIRRETARAQRFSTPLSLLIFDVDRFKSINDRYGHEKGDGVLRLVTERVTRILGSTEGFFRIGGDEFAALVPESEEVVHSILVRLNELFGKSEERQRSDPDDPGITVGVASYTFSETPAELFHRADADMYRRKREGCFAARDASNTRDSQGRGLH